MILTVFGMLPKKLATEIGALASLNNWVIIPLSVKTASKVTTSLGILNKKEAENQERLFYEMIKPYTDILDEIENGFIELLTNGWNNVVESIMGDQNKYNLKETKKDLKQDNPDQPIKDKTIYSKTNNGIDILLNQIHENINKQTSKNIDSKMYELLQDTKTPAEL